MLIYSFENFSYKESISHYSPFYFKKLKADLVEFNEIIMKSDSDKIFGIAKSPYRYSFFFSHAYNVYNRSKKVSRKGPDRFELDYPRGGFKDIRVSTRLSDTFCNWTAYKISELIQKRDNSLTFIHICETDINQLVEFLKLSQK